MKTKITILEFIKKYNIDMRVYEMMTLKELINLGKTNTKITSEIIGYMLARIKGETELKPLTPEHIIEWFNAACNLFDILKNDKTIPAKELSELLNN